MQRRWRHRRRLWALFSAHSAPSALWGSVSLLFATQNCISALAAARLGATLGHPVLGSSGGTTHRKCGQVAKMHSMRRWQHISGAYQVVPQRPQLRPAGGEWAAS